MQKVLDYPDIFLDEIMRQAKESEIIRFSMHIREGRGLDTYFGENQEVQVLTKEQLFPEIYTMADQVICATNAMRIGLNHGIREFQGRGKEPEIGDKIICLHNEWDTFSANGEPLTNGQIGYITNFEKDRIKVNRCQYYPVLITSIDVPETQDKYSNLPIDYHCLRTGESALTPEQKYKMFQNSKKANSSISPPPLLFDYSYAVSLWKFQGSQANKILGFEENHPFSKKEHQKYLYTLTTRAQEKLILVRK